MEQHSDLVREISEHIKAWNSSDRKKKLRIFHGGSNSTRQKDSTGYEYVDVSRLNKVLEVNSKEKWVLTEPNVSMRSLAKETLKYGLLPEAVMEFPEITVGGAIQGAALESSSFKYGQFNDSCIEYKIVTGNGEVIITSSNLHSDLHFGISGSYGTLAIIVQAKIKLIPASKYVKVAYVPTCSFEETTLVLKKEASGTNDFVEAIIFSPDRGVVITGSFTNNAVTNIRKFSRAIDPWFYRHAEEMAKNEKCIEYVPIEDYLFRYDRGAFWMGKYVFSISRIPNIALARFLLSPFLTTKKLYEGLHAIQISQEYFVQDFYFPFDKAVEYLKYAHEKMGIYPIWLCPVKSTNTPQKLSPHFRLDGSLFLNVGIYGQSKKFLKNDPIVLNRDMENFAANLGARKMLYAHTYYPKEDFWKIYDYSWYKVLREKYGAEKVFPEVWEKVFVSQRYRPKVLKGLIKVNYQTIRKFLFRVL